MKKKKKKKKIKTFPKTFITEINKGDEQAINKLQTLN